MNLCAICFWEINYRKWYNEWRKAKRSDFLYANVYINNGKHTMTLNNEIEMDTPPERPKILIVDDEKVNIDVLVNLLKPDYRMVAAKSGEQAFKRLEKPPLPDLILLDVMMPGMDGFEFCRELQHKEKMKTIPVIFLTARTAPEDIVTGFKTGAVDYLTKPFKAEELFARVNTHIRLRKTINQLERALREIKTLRGLLPICASCKKIRDDKGYWTQIEEYIMTHSEAEFTHGICPDCMRKLYPNYDL